MHPTTRALDRGLLLLGMLMEHGPQSLTALAADSGLPKSTTHRLLATLCLRGYAKLMPDGRYALASASFRLAGAMPRIELELEFLRTQIGETINLGMLVGRDVQYVARALSNQALRWGIDVGHRVPCYCTGMGKAIMAFRPDVHYEPHELVPRTDATVGDPATLDDELELVRARGYSVDREEFMAGVVCIGVPVAGPSGTVIGALSASGPAVRFDLEGAARFANLLMASAAVIGNLLDPAAPIDAVRAPVSRK